MGDIDTRSVGAATPQRAGFLEPLILKAGKTLASYELVYETYGTLNADRSNAVLVCHALTGDSHASGPLAPGHPTAGWWDAGTRGRGDGGGFGLRASWTSLTLRPL